MGMVFRAVRSTRGNVQTEGLLVALCHLFSVNVASKLIISQFKLNFEALIELEEFYHVCTNEFNNSYLVQKGFVPPFFREDISKSSYSIIFGSHGQIRIICLVLINTLLRYPRSDCSTTS